VTVNDLIQCTANKVNGVSVKKFHAAAQKAQPGCFPVGRRVDHKLAPNPYKSFYGPDEWEEKIKNTTALNGHRSITDLIVHMAVETSKMFEGTAHAHDCVFYHDALALLTAFDAIDWMKENYHTDGRLYIKMWVRPEQGLNAGTRYERHPPGNSPELMPLDASLNNDIHQAVDLHVAFTRHLRPGDPGYEERFSRSTPALQSSAYLRLHDPDLGPEAGTPLGSRICQDIGKFIPALEAIRDARGIIIPGLGTRNGHRAAASNGKAQRGGKREKGASKGDIWVHPDAAGARIGLMEASLERSNNQSI